MADGFGLRMSGLMVGSLLVVFGFWCLRRGWVVPFGWFLGICVSYGFVQ